MKNGLTAPKGLHLNASSGTVRQLKIVVCLTLLVITGFFGGVARAAICQVTGARVTEVIQWGDGYIFVNLDISTGCSCSTPYRVAFHKNDNEKFMMAQVLLAHTTGKSVLVRAQDNNGGACPIHGNTAKLVAFMLLQQ